MQELLYSVGILKILSGLGWNAYIPRTCLQNLCMYLRQGSYINMIGKFYIAQSFIFCRIIFVIQDEYLVQYWFYTIKFCGKQPMSTPFFNQKLFRLSTFSSRTSKQDTCIVYYFYIHIYLNANHRNPSFLYQTINIYHLLLSSWVDSLLCSSKSWEYE